VRAICHRGDRRNRSCPPRDRGDRRGLQRLRRIFWRAPLRWFGGAMCGVGEPSGVYAGGPSAFRCLIARTCWASSAIDAPAMEPIAARIGCQFDSVTTQDRPLAVKGVREAMPERFIAEYVCGRNAGIVREFRLPSACYDVVLAARRSRSWQDHADARHRVKVY